MSPKNEDLFHQLRRAGVRKQVAKTLSELSEDASTKAISAGHRAVAELRVLADEIEKRLPAQKPESIASAQPTPAVTAARSSARKTTAPKAQKKTAARSTKPAARKPVAAGSTKPAIKKSVTSASPAPRGENKAKILAVLQGGPRTASEIGQETGIPTATVSASLTRMSRSGEVVKATRGYGLPG